MREPHFVVSEGRQGRTTAGAAGNPACTGTDIVGAILATTVYAMGFDDLRADHGPLVDRFGIGRIIASLLCLGALCVLAIRVFALPFALLCLVTCGAWIGVGGYQHGINAGSGARYPLTMRATGAGWGWSGSDKLAAG